MPVRDKDLAAHLLAQVESAADITLEPDRWIDPAVPEGSRRKRDWSKVAASPDLQGVIKALERAESNARRFRSFLESVRDGIPARTCDACGKEMYGRADRRYCSGACRQDAHRKRNRSA